MYLIVTNIQICAVHELCEGCAAAVSRIHREFATAVDTVIQPQYSQ